MQRHDALVSLKQSRDELEDMACTETNAASFVLWRAQTDSALVNLEGEEGISIFEFRSLRFSPCTHMENKRFAWKIDKARALALLQSIVLLHITEGHE